MEDNRRKSTGLIHDIREMMKDPARSSWFLILLPISLLPIAAVIAVAVMILVALWHSLS